MFVLFSYGYCNTHWTQSDEQELIIGWERRVKERQCYTLSSTPTHSSADIACHVMLYVMFQWSSSLKLSLCFQIWQYTMANGCTDPHFFASALFGDKLPASRCRLFTPKESRLLPPGTDNICCWVGPRADLGDVYPVRYGQTYRVELSFK
jgi:hypothetical protein